MTREQWTELKPRIFRDFPECCYVSNVNLRKEKGDGWGVDEDPIFDDAGNSIGLPFSDVEPQDFLYDIFGLCGCGDPMSVVEKYYYPFLVAIKAHHEKDRGMSFEEIMSSCFERETEIFNKILKGEHINWTSYRVVEDQALEYLVLYALDHLGLTEHGTSITGSWLTPKGETALMICNIVFEYLKPKEI